MRHKSHGPRCDCAECKATGCGAFSHRVAPEDKPLGEPKMKFEETFSAETVILEMFFPTKSP